jgi:hypothetical protein
MTPAPPAPPAQTAVDLRRRLWPDAVPRVRPAVLVAAGAAGLLAALALPQAPPGAGTVAVGALAAAAVALQRRRAWTPAELGLLALAGALLLVAAVRDAQWLVALCGLAACGLGALSVSGARSWTAAVLTPSAVLLAGLRAPGWVARGTSAEAGHRARWVAVARSAVVTVALLGVFGALLASADAAFARLAGYVVPDVQLGEVPGRVVLALVVAGVVLAACYLAVAPPRWDLVQLPGGRPLRRAEWLVPVAALDLLLLTFLAVQSAALSDDHVLRTAGLTYAEYARAGFGQLLTVTVLVLAVVAAAVRWAPRGGLLDARVVRTALGLLLALTVAVAVSALVRLHLYEQAFGTTRARLFAAAVEVEIVVVLLLVAWVGARGTARAAGLLPRAVAVTAGLSLLALAAVDADAVVARRDVDRALRGATVDTAYLGQLSADAVPELDRLPEPQRSCALTPIARSLALHDGGGWAEADVARARARALLTERPVRAVDDATCPVAD